MLGSVCKVEVDRMYGDGRNAWWMGDRRRMSRGKLHKERSKECVIEEVDIEVVEGIKEWMIERRGMNCSKLYKGRAMEEVDIEVVEGI